jgi:hypothetical protein
MRRRNSSFAVGGWRSFLMAAISILAASTSVCAHHQSSREGANIGNGIPAITHGEVLVVAKYRAEILDLAARQPRTDPTMRRLAGFVSLQYFACFWGLVPGSLTDETSPFNECSHAYAAGVRALLAHMLAMPGDQSPARVLEARIETEIASDPGYSALCSNSSEAFVSGIVIGPDWQLAPSHLPTLATFLSLLVLAMAGVWIVSRSVLARIAIRKASIEVPN